MKKIFNKKMATLIAAATVIAFPLTSYAANKLVVRDNTDVEKFVVTDTGNVGIGSAAPTIPLHVYTTGVAAYTDVLGSNTTTGTGADIQTSAGAPPTGAIQAVSNAFLVKYHPGATITNNFNTFRMIARTDASVSDSLTGQFSAANFQAQHNGTGTATLVLGFVTNVAARNTGNITTAAGVRVANPTRLSTGSFTNVYGVHVQSQKVTGVTNGYAFYQDGVNDLNYFAGKIGIGVTAPTYPIQLAGGAYSDGTNWVDASSRDLKENINTLSSDVALKTLDGLAPVTFNYKTNTGDNHVGFIAEDVPDMVATPDRKGLSALDIVAVLTKVVQEQRKTIDMLQDRVEKLENQGQ